MCILNLFASIYEKLVKNPNYINIFPNINSLIFNLLFLSFFKNCICLSESSNDKLPFSNDFKTGHLY